MCIIGTNVGIDADDGSLYGRRLRLDAAAESYQKTDIRALRGRQVQVAKLRAGLGLESSVRFRLYGELVCKNRFDYSQQRLFKSFKVFGAVADVSSLSANDRNIALKRVHALGMAANGTWKCGSINEDEGKEPALLVICVNDAFRSLVSSCEVDDGSGASDSGGETVAQESHGSLVSVVAETIDWMTQCRGEGLVLTWSWCTRSSGKRGSDGIQFETAKYKCACEDQGSTAAVLEKLQTHLLEFSEVLGCGFLLPPGVVDNMIPQMLAVSKADPPGGAGPKKKKDTESSAPAQSNAMVEKALTSALTKVDAPESFFDIYGGDEGRKILVDQLVGEIRSDLLTDCEGKDEGEEKRVLAAGRAAVAKYVGTALGKWKASEKQKKV